MLGLGLFQLFFTICWWKMSPKHSREPYNTLAPREMQPLAGGDPTHVPVQRSAVQSEPLLRRSTERQEYTPSGRPLIGQDEQPFSPNQITKFIDADKSKESLA